MENFVVSARKYRPATFVSVVGQNHITSTLKNAISRNQLAHAYLFCGPRGVGKTTCARIFAKAINCLSPVDSEACNQCESCRGFNESRSFNIHELDAASNNSVDDIRSLTDQVRIPPQIGRYSVYIIDEVHMLSAQAFNAFLKTLEEPPTHAIFILATTEKHKIIPTILSRCQIFDFNRIRVEDSVSYLKYIASQESITYDDESLNLISAKADGGMRDALSMFDKAVSFCGSDLHYKDVAQAMNVLDYDTYFSVTELLLSGSYPDTLLLFDSVLSKGFSGQTFLAGLNAHFRDLLMCKNPQTLPLLEVTGSLLDRYKSQSANCDVGFMFQAIALLTELDGTLRTATNSRLNVELGLMKLCGLGQKKNSDEPRLELPTLVVRGSNAESKPHEAQANPSKPQPAIQSQSASAVQSSASVQPHQEGQPKAQEAATQQIAISSPIDNTTSSAPVEQPSATPKRSFTSLSGKSIASIMQAKIGDDVVAEAGEEKTEIKNIDPQSEQKILSTKDRFIKRLKIDRPRMAMAFGDMTVNENCVSVAVPTKGLEEEILRNRSEILSLMAEVAQINGTITLNIEMVEQLTGIRPIKVEDRLKHLTEKNPLLTKLRKEMDLDIE